MQLVSITAEWRPTSTYKSAAHFPILWQRHTHLQNSKISWVPQAFPYTPKTDTQVQRYTDWWFYLLMFESRMLEGRTKKKVFNSDYIWSAYHETANLHVMRNLYFWLIGHVESPLIRVDSWRFEKQKAQVPPGVHISDSCTALTGAIAEIWTLFPCSLSHILHSQWHHMSSHLTLPHLHNQWVRAGGDVTEQDVPTKLLRIVGPPQGVVCLSPWGWIFHEYFWETLSTSWNLHHHYLICRDFHSAQKKKKIWHHDLRSYGPQSPTVLHYYPRELISEWHWQPRATLYYFLKSMQDECLSRGLKWRNGMAGTVGAKWDFANYMGALNKWFLGLVVNTKTLAWIYWCWKKAW